MKGPGTLLWTPLTPADDDMGPCHDAGRTSTDLFEPAIVGIKGRWTGTLVPSYADTLGLSRQHKLAMVDHDVELGAAASTEELPERKPIAFGGLLDGLDAGVVETLERLGQGLDAVRLKQG